MHRSQFLGACRAEMSNTDCLAFDIDTTVVKPKARLTERSRRTAGNTVEATVEVRSGLYTAAGVERMRGGQGPT